MAKKRQPQRKVGYKNPPSANRFGPGISGNPKGRPKGSKNILKVIEKELDNRIGVTEGGARKTITKRVAAIKQLVNKAIGGDARALALLLKTAAENEEEPSKQTEVAGPTEQRMMESIKRRIRLADPSPTETDADPKAPGSDPAQPLN